MIFFKSFSVLFQFFFRYFKTFHHFVIKISKRARARAIIKCDKNPKAERAGTNVLSIPHTLLRVTYPIPTTMQTTTGTFSDWHTGKRLFTHDGYAQKVLRRAKRVRDPPFPCNGLCWGSEGRVPCPNTSGNGWCAARQDGSPRSCKDIYLLLTQEEQETHMRAWTEMTQPAYDLYLVPIRRTLQIRMLSVLTANNELVMGNAHTMLANTIDAHSPSILANQVATLQLADAVDAQVQP